MQKHVAHESMNTYAPLAQCSTVWLMLIMTCILKLKTVSIDFFNAFTQADMPKDSNIHIKCLKGYELANGQNMVLKLNKSFYG